ncbi:hypothetical protein Tsubulata_016038 [Turnera subulata]|uniref:Homeobox domain-containing protein n=1 Tax=Turnera subulata TaxID=218843 RepID=A0A9Q0J3N2_9ROSI|nr:hypothetical protein Tsubulata_016038 [Turnera subulata]
MATYFHGSSEIQAAAPADGIQTLYLMNPNYLSSYSDASQNQQQQQQQQPPPNMLFFNPNTGTTGLNPATLHHHQVPPPNHHHLVGIPLPGASSSNPEGQSRSPPPPSLHGVIPGIQYNIWDQSSVVSVAAAASDSSGAHDMVSAAHMGFRRPAVVSPGRQGLSLSLSSQQAQAYHQNRPVGGEHEIQALHPHVTALSSGGGGGEDVRVSGNSPTSASAVSNGVSGVQSVVLGSKYLRATQELLDEVVNVGKSLKGDHLMKSPKEKTKMNKESSNGEGSSGGGETSSKRGAAELTTAQRQELQMKKAKLVNMLDEVEQRYRQYHHQMQLVVSSFEQAAGFGAAKSYTALALQTISKQFRCLKDAIADQIKATSKSLGDEDCLGARIEGSRLRYVDHQLRQQRALQQIGMIQHNAWRPQRGLPERAVSVLRAWLFEHFLHPYPKDSDKHMLAKQTGLTRSQVSNWFINARVRLWKPMVEEMYLEEIKEHEKNGSEENTSQNENKDSGSNSSALGESSRIKMDRLAGFQSKHDKSNQQQQNAPATATEFSNATVSMSNIGGVIQPQAGFTLIRSSEMEALAQRSAKKQMNGDMENSPSSILSMDMDMKQGETAREMISVSFGGERLTKDGYPLITSTPNHGGAFGAYPMGDLARINADQLTPRYGGNAVSLTLGLPHNENLSLPGAQQSYLPNQNIQLGRRLESMGGGEPEFHRIETPQNSHSSSGFESIDIQNRKRFPAQLLPDFVA